MGIERKKPSAPLCVSVWQLDAVAMSGRLLCFPWLLKLGIRGAGWAGLPVGGEKDPAGVWLHSNPGDYYRWDTHTYTPAVVFAAGVSPGSCGFPRS